MTEKSEIDVVIDEIFEQLSSTEATSQDGLQKLQDLIEKSKHSLRPSSPKDSNWLESLETKITSFMTTKPYNPNKQRSALIALDLLIKNQVRLTHYTRHLGTITLIRPSKDIELQEHAASTLGKLHQASGNKHTQSAEYQIRIFFEFLNHCEDDTQMLQAVLMLREIATSMPSLFIGKAEGDHFFSRIIPAFKSNSETRNRGSALLNVVIRLYAMREEKDRKKVTRLEQRNTWAYQVYKNFRSLSENLSNETDCHGAILMLHELVSVANKLDISPLELKLQDYHAGSFAPLRKQSFNALPVEKFEALQESNQSRKELPKNVHSKISRNMVTSHFHDICNSVLSIMLVQPTNKDPNVRASLISLIPRLAAVDPSEFENHKVEGPIAGFPGLKKIFHESLTYLIDSYNLKTQVPDKRPNVSGGDTNTDCEIKSLALLVQIMSNRIMDSPTHKERIMKHISQIFIMEPMSLKRSRGGSLVPQPLHAPPSAYALIACFVQALNYSMTESEMHKLVDLAMKHGLNRYLALCLHDICSNAPLDNFAFKLQIKNKLFTEISSKIVHFEAVKVTEESNATNQNTMLKKKMSTVSNAPGRESLDANEDITTAVIMALEILAAFDFTGVALSGTVGFCADKLLNYDKGVRLAAAKACCNLLISDDASFLLDSNRAKTALYEADRTLRTTLPKIINIGVTDPSAQVRLAIVSSLDARFDPFLAQVDNLNSLFIALYDECFKVREYIVCILGRLSEANAAYVMPALRKFLLQSLKELQYTEVPKARERCSVLLGNLLYNTPRLLTAYMESVMNCLIPKLIAANETSNVNATDIAVSISFMRTIGILAEVSGRDIAPYFPKLMPTILDFIKDSQNTKRKIAGLWTLGNLIFSGGNVVQPCIDYPELLELLLEMIKSEVSVAVRNQTIKVLGSLGPLDPYVYKTILQPAMFQSLRLAEKETENADPNLSDLTSMIETAVMDDVYPAVATDALLKILGDATQSQYWPRVIEGFKFMVVSMGIKSVSFIGRVIPAYLNVLQNIPINTDRNKMSEIVLISLTKIVNTVKDHIRPYLKEIVECLSQVWSTALEKNLIELLGCLAKYVGSDLKQHFHLVLPKVIEIIKRDVKSPNPVVKSLVESFRTYGVMLEGYIHILLPALMGCLEATNQSILKIEICSTLIYFCEKMDMTDYSSLMIHSLLRVVEHDHYLNQRLSYSSQSSSGAGTSIGPQGNVTLPVCDRPVTNRVFDVLAAICFILKTRFHIFRPVVEQVADKYRVNHLNYLFVLENIDHMFYSQTGKYRSDIGARIFDRNKNRAAAPGQLGPAMEIGAAQRHSIESDLPMLKRSWSTEGKVSKDDWTSWFKNLSFMLLNKSPSPILRGCSLLDHPQLRKDLFNVAFLSCWVELDQLHQDELIHELKTALEFEDAPELTLAILNLAEFMEHSEKGPLPLDHLLLGKVAEKNGAYAKALYYRESALRSHEPGAKEIPEILESLLHVNTKLHNYDAATGVLKLATTGVDESWYESLGQWENALKQYNLKVGEALKPKHVVGKMRCLEGLAEWEDLQMLVKDVWGRTDYLVNDYPETIADLGVKACWALGNWEEMNTFITALPTNAPKQTFYKAAYALHKKDTINAMKLIQDCRDLVDNDLTTLVKESYSRAYGTLVELKHFSEMEEVISYTFMRSRQDSIKQMWRDRLLGGQPNVHDWQNSLLVHSLAIRPEDNEVTLLKFAGLCMRQNRMKISFKVLQSLLPDIKFPDNQKLQEIRDPDILDHEIGDMTERLADACSNKISVVYMFLKQLWEVHRRNDLVKRRLIQSLGMITNKVMGLYSGMYVPEMMMAARRYDNGRGKQVARFCLLYASWQKSFGINVRSISDIIANCQYATENCKNWYKAWRMLAESSAEAFQLMRASGSSNGGSSGSANTLHIPSQQTSLPVGPSPQMYARSSSARSLGSTNGSQSMLQTSHSNPVTLHFLVAVNAFVKSIRCCWDKKKDTLQDTLRLLTLLFENAGILESPEFVLDTLKQVHVDVWLQVIPQLIARVASARSVIGKIIIPLLVDIGKAHPHAAVYSLMVGAKSTSPARAQAVQTVLDAMKDRYPEIVKQAQILSHELIRVSILWHELWHEGLEEASRMYFADRNPRGMFAILEPLHDLIEKGAETMKEQSFMQHFGRDLTEAKECCNRYQQQGNARELSQAWDLYYQVFRLITKQNLSMTSLELNYVSPRLLNACRDLDLAVPGTYEPNQPIIRISSVNPVVMVIGSKQKPRKLCISGSNGKDYQFLLKGHEDMRQDERVLQLFGLVNSLLDKDKHNLKRNLGAIPQYAVIPLSTNSGLCGWVPHCDPLHTLIKEFREKTKIHLNWEHRLMQKMAPDYDHLTKMQKVEVFENALNNTNGMDLAKIMWYRSANSEIWYERRLTYTKSLAVMSMVGYILGLGDRHPSNIMLERTTGNIIHIDFGDCFEVAVHREKFPEKIPFRLTRMLIKAMEVNGIEGNYRAACETTMRLLRQNKDSLIAVLEAFVNDPLLNWLALDMRNGHQQNVPYHGSQQSQYHSQRSNGAVNGQPTSNNGHQRGSSRGTATNGASGDAALNLGHAVGQPEGNRKALDVLKRVNDKLDGADFGPNAILDVETQVSKLITQATSHENLCQSYIGWCPFW